MFAIRCCGIVRSINSVHSLLCVAAVMRLRHYRRVDEKLNIQSLDMHGLSMEV